MSAFVSTAKVGPDFGAKEIEIDYAPDATSDAVWIRMRSPGAYFFAAVSPDLAEALAKGLIEAAAKVRTVLNTTAAPAANTGKE